MKRHILSHPKLGKTDMEQIERYTTNLYGGCLRYSREFTMTRTSASFYISKCWVHSNISSYSFSGMDHGALACPPPSNPSLNDPEGEGDIAHNLHHVVEGQIIKHLHWDRHQILSDATVTRQRGRGNCHRTRPNPNCLNLLWIHIPSEKVIGDHLCRLGRSNSLLRRWHPSLM